MNVSTHFQTDQKIYSLHHLHREPTKRIKFLETDKLRKKILKGKLKALIVTKINSLLNNIHMLPRNEKWL